MWKTLPKPFNSPWILSILSGALVFLSFERFKIFPLIFLFPIFFNLLLFQVKNKKQAFGYGFLTSFVIMLGGFYWVTYVIHEFGYLPWSVSALLFLGFCGFGALNFPLFLLVAYPIKKRLSPIKMIFFLPALFTFIEFIIPKLFPWYIGHSLFKQIYLIQISEITGSIFLTFSIYSFGTWLGIILFLKNKKQTPKWLCFIPLSLWLATLLFGYYRIHISPPDSTGKQLSVAMIQANIGSLEKVAAEKGIGERVRIVVNRYLDLTDEVLKNNTVDLVVWPETAMPFQMETNKSYPKEIKNYILSKKIPFLLGGYEQSPKNDFRDFNSAFLFEPQEKILSMQSYQKNILLAFGEYFPFGESFPILYRWFPQVSDFERGKIPSQSFTLSDGTQLGVTICYEAIVPAFYRKVAQNGIHAMINITNDSWFGPTSEPYLHASLTPFRTIETRTPLFRVTNTGTSFAIDSLGRTHGHTSIFEAQSSVVQLGLPQNPPMTFYLKYGDWFIYILMIILGLCFLF